jgi:hypothetical protein
VVCEVGHNINEAFVQITSDQEAGDTAPRTVLRALLTVELQACGEELPSSLLTAQSRVVDLPLPARHRRLAHLRTDRWAGAMLDDDVPRIAAALEHEIRSSSPPVTEIDDRLHKLFAIERGADTTGLTTTVDASIAFARALDLGTSIHVNIDGTAWATVGGTNRHTAWRWTTEYVELPPAKALLVAILRVLQ